MGRGFRRQRAAVALLVFPMVVAGACAAPADRPDRVILFIADGAGVAHWTLAAYEIGTLQVSRMRTLGLVDTRGAEHTVSGSAPTATAYATGVRSFMGAVGVGADSLPARNAVEVAAEAGRSSGLITTTLLVDATPAAFSAHVVARSEFGRIARQMLDAGVSVLMGGGRAAFGRGLQPDSADLFGEIRERYTYVETLDALRGLDLDSVASLMGLFAEGDMGVVAERGTALQDMTSAALTILDRDPDGFFLMVENEESDTQSHRNADQATITAEMLDFDQAVGLALDYQAEHPGTLVLVTGDHETGGITLTYDPTDPVREPIMQYASGAHTGTLIPLFASGPGEERFSGILRNDRVGQILLELLGPGEED